MFEDIAEVAEVTFKLVNDHLEHGYRLLGVYNNSGTGKQPNGNFYVKKYITYVVGRTAETPQFTPVDAQAEAKLATLAP